MKTAKEAYQQHAVQMGEAMRAARDSLVELSTLDLTPGDLVNAIDAIDTMLIIGREHALRMCIYDVLMQHAAEQEQARNDTAAEEAQRFLDDARARWQRNRSDKGF